MAAIKLNLTPIEKRTLRSRKFKMSDLADLEISQIELILEVSQTRAREIHGLAEFQSIPSVGIKFAEDLVFLGYYSLDQLKDRNGAELLNDYERKKGFQTDPCVEDQFWLVVDYANHQDHSKRWWDFSPARKQFRQQFGYPESRPGIAWHELSEYQR